jgi:hypothetical protein
MMLDQLDRPPRRRRSRACLVVSSYLDLFALAAQRDSALARERAQLDAHDRALEDHAAVSCRRDELAEVGAG